MLMIFQVEFYEFNLAKQNAKLAWISIIEAQLGLVKGEYT